MKKIIIWFPVASMFCCCVGCQEQKQQTVSDNPSEPSTVTKNLLPSKIISTYDGNTYETEIIYTEKSITFARNIWAHPEGENPTFMPSWVISPNETAQQVAIGFLAEENGTVEYGYTYKYEGDSVIELIWANEVHFRMDYAQNDSAVLVIDTDYSPEKEAYLDDSFTIFLSDPDKTVTMDLDWGLFKNQTLTYLNGILTWDALTCEFDAEGRLASASIEGRTVSFIYENDVENTYYQGQMAMPMIMTLSLFGRPEYILATQIAYQQFEN